MQSSYWCAALLKAGREALALHCLGLAGYLTYCPRLRAQRLSHGRRIEVRPLLFPGYCFVFIELQWSAARWAPGTLGLIMNGEGPSRVPEAVIAELRSRERNGLIELPKSPKLRRGDAIRVIHGPLQGLRGLYEGMKPHERVAVLLRILGARQRVELPANAIAPVGGVP
jgi:transcriptional antiterminator RfaH